MQTSGGSTFAEGRVSIGGKHRSSRLDRGINCTRLTPVVLTGTDLNVFSLFLYFNLEALIDLIRLYQLRSKCLNWLKMNLVWNKIGNKILNKNKLCRLACLPTYFHLFRYLYMYARVKRTSFDRSRFGVRSMYVMFIHLSNYIMEGL